MAEVKGKFITLTGARMAVLHKRALAFCDTILVQKTGKHWNELDPEGWYDTKIFEGFMVNYAKTSLVSDRAIVMLGREVYPTIKETVGLPENIKTAYDLILFEAEGFMQNHRGEGVVPRKFIKKELGHVVVQAHAPGYNQKLFEGVYLGILQMFDEIGTVTFNNENSVCEYHIKWNV